MRTREFTMKDSYSFDLAAEGLDRSFDLHHEAYTRIFARLGIPAIPVEASSGSMGGSTSTEFMCPSPTGEDFVVHCPACGYAANIEKATSRFAAVTDEPGPATPERFDTPGARTIEDLAQRFAAPADRQIKTLVYVVDGKPTLVLLRGDHKLAEQKLADAVGAAELRPAHAEEIRELLGAAPGSLGAVAVSGLPVVADLAVRGRTNMFTGANTDDVHLRGVDVARDIEVAHWADLREVTAGEPCPTCDQPLQVQKAIEVGHIFKLGYKYSEALGASVLDAEGKRVPVIMGSYGIGVERAMSAIVECHHDDRGIIWPVAVAPFEVAVVIAQPKDEETAAAGEKLYADLLAAGVDVVVDDRPDRVGVKFSDVELVGIPFRITVGKRGLADRVVELTTRATGETRTVPVDAVVTEVRAAIAG
jgi:prolyl-tRNA synthetase